MTFQRLPALGSLRAFEAAARLSSFKRAAEELSVTPGAVSQQIRALEEDLGVKLFSRGVRAVTLTDEGRKLQPALTAAFMQIRDAVALVRPNGTRPLSLNSSSAIISKWLLPRLHRFSERHPETGVTIETSSGLETFDGEGPDVAIRFTRTQSAGLYARRLCEEHLLPLASPELVERLKLREPEDLARAPLLHDASPQIFSGAPDWAAWFARAGLDPSGAQRGIRFDARAADHAIDAAVNGAGVVLGRCFLSHNDRLEGRLVSPFGPILPMHAGYFVVCKAGDEARPDIAAFIDWMCDEIEMMSTQPAPSGTFD